MMNIFISNTSQEPIYQQITAQIKKSIFRGDLKEGDLLPSIRSLAKELQISVITTKRAYEELEKDGFIETVTGKGSYVAPHNKELLKEKCLKIVEEKLIDTIQEAKVLNLSSKKLSEMLKRLYEEE